MNKSIRSIVILAVLALVLAAGVIAQQKSDTAIDPVCGMTVTKAKAAASFDYKGTTYYFCSTGCRDKFAKDPEPYLKAAEAKAPAQSAQPGQMGQMGHMGQMGEMGQGQMMMKHAQGGGQNGACPMMPGQMGGNMGRMGMMRRMGPGMRGAGPMGAPGMGLLFQLYGDKIDVTVENTKDGAVLKFSSKDPEVAKAIQVHLAEHLAMMKKMKESAAKAATGGAPDKESGMVCCDKCPMKK